MRIRGRIYQQNVRMQIPMSILRLVEARKVDLPRSRFREALYALARRDHPGEIICDYTKVQPDA